MIEICFQQARTVYYTECIFSMKRMANKFHPMLSKKDFEKFHFFVGTFLSADLLTFF